MGGSSALFHFLLQSQNTEWNATNSFDVKVFRILPVSDVSTSGCKNKDEELKREIRLEEVLSLPYIDKLGVDQGRKNILYELKRNCSQKREYVGKARKKDRTVSACYHTG